MTIALYVIQILLGLLFVITGSFKFFQSREKVIESGGAWAEDFAPGVIKSIAGVELLSGLTLLASKIPGLGRYPTLFGAGVIGLIMIGSIYVHLRRREYKHAGINAVFLVMAVVVFCGGEP